MLNFFGKIKQMVENRPGKIRRRMELLAKAAEVQAPLKSAVMAASDERKKLKDTLDGVFVIAATKTLDRAMQPINEELGQLTRELQQNPPELIENFLEQLDRLEAGLRAQFDAEPEMVKQNQTGDWIEKLVIDRESVQSAIAVVRDKMREAGELSLVDLTPAELRARIDTIRNRPLPVLRKKRLTRPDAGSLEHQETLV